jgi:hypothetical protein
MSDEYSRSELTLGAALRALPMQSPNGDVWAQLAAQLKPSTRARRARYVWPSAIAACALLAIATLFLTMQTTHNATVADTSTSSVDNATTETVNVNATNVDKGTNIQLVALQLHSRELEQWLHATADAATPLPGNDLAAAGEIESLIGVVDVELAAPQQHDVEKLWQRRVNLLEDLTTLRYSNYRMAETSAAVNAGQPSTWIN